MGFLSTDSVIKDLFRILRFLLMTRINQVFCILIFTLNHSKIFRRFQDFLLQTPAPAIHTDPPPLLTTQPRRRGWVVSSGGGAL